MLTVADLDAGYGQTRVLRGVSLALAPGEVLCLMGRNGAGKSTTLKAIMGLVPPTAGSITLDATRLDTLPAHDVPRQGVAWVPQGRRLFAELTVAENLEVGLLARRSAPAVRERALALFPASASASARPPAPSPAASSRCSPSPARSAPSPACSSSTSPPRACSPR